MFAVTKETPQIGDHTGQLHINLVFSWNEDAVSAIIDQSTLKLAKDELDTLRRGFRYDPDFGPPRHGNFILDHDGTRIRCHYKISRIGLFLREFDAAFRAVSLSLDDYIHNYYFRFEGFPLSANLIEGLKHMRVDPNVSSVESLLGTKLMPVSIELKNHPIITRHDYVSMRVEPSTHNPMQFARLRMSVTKQKTEEMLQFLEDLPNIVKEIKALMG